jgi:hypothetical protein
MAEKQKALAEFIKNIFRTALAKAIRMIDFFLKIWLKPFACRIFNH